MSTLVKPISYGPSSAANPNEGRRYGGAFWVSVTVHGALIGVMLLLAVVVHEKLEEPRDFFEMVGGDGNNYMATEAPGGGEVGEVTSADLFQAPKVPVAKIPPAVEPEPAAEEPTPVAPVPPPREVVTAVAPVAPKAPEVPKAPNLAQDFKRKVAQQKKKDEAASKKRLEAEARAAKEAALKDKRMTHADFVKENAAKAGAGAKSTSTAANPGKRINVNSLSANGPGGPGTGNAPGAGGPALARAQQDALDSYFAMLIQMLKRNHEKPEGLSDLLSADVSFRIGADGTISQVTITRSSGNPDFDRSVLAAFARTGTIGPRPDKKSDTSRLTFRMKEVD